MKKVSLFTKEDIYKSSFEKTGFFVQQFNTSFSQTGECGFLNNSNEYLIIELMDDLKINENWLKKCNLQGKVICIAESITNDLRDLILKNGISDVIEAKHPDRLTAYVNLLSNQKKIENGSILIFEEQENRIQVLNNIITRFGIQPVFTSIIDEAIEYLNNDKTQFFLINIENPNFRVQEFIKKTYNSSINKKIPFIAYKDFNSGIYIHEVVSGLNKLTKFLLTPCELYSFLLDMLFRKEIIPLINNLNQHFNFENNFVFSTEELSKVFFSNEKNVFDYDNIFNDVNFDIIINSVKEIRNSLIKIYGLKWLKHENESIDTLTCGVCV